jgi:3-hydroxyisobutyrate dehydrogenase-like beta-hydroxyacid dehydrogenase
MELGFIGTGHMGGPMAANLLADGNQLVVYDLSPEATAPLEEAGAERAAGVREVGERADTVFLSLPGPPEVEAVVEGEGGLLDALGAGKTLIDLSTNSPRLVARLAAAAARRDIGFLDAPVSGGVRGARKATLAVMVGGERETFEKCERLLRAIGSNVFYVGSAGTGNVAKLVNNMLAFSAMMANAEALALGAAAGVDPHTLWEIVRASSGNSFTWENGGRAILRDRLAPTFTTRLACKDIGLATELARQLGVPVPMGECAEALLQHYRATGYEDEDVLASIRALEAQTGARVRGTWRE